MSVYRADVAGDSRTGLVLLYAKLGSVSVGGDYRPVSWTLEMAAGPRHILRASVATADIVPSIVRIGNINGIPGDEVIVQPDEISSGSYVNLYALEGRSLRVVGTFVAGGDSVDQSGFLCRQMPSPRIVQYVGTTDASNIFTGAWNWKSTTYLWHGETLQRGPSRTFDRKGIRSVSAPRQGWGAGCGTLVGSDGDG